MEDDEGFLADKGYVGTHGAIAPDKKPVGGKLTQKQKDYNNALPLPPLLGPFTVVVLDTR